MAYHREKLRFTELAAEAEEHGWKLWRQITVINSLTLWNDFHKEFQSLQLYITFVCMLKKRKPACTYLNVWICKKKRKKKKLKKICGNILTSDISQILLNEDTNFYSVYVTLKLQWDTIINLVFMSELTSQSRCPFTAQSKEVNVSSTYWLLRPGACWCKLIWRNPGQTLM